CLGGVGRNVRVGAVQERRVDQHRKDDEGDREEDGGDELDEDEIRPNEHFLLTLPLGAGSGGTGGAAGCWRRFNRHWRSSPLERPRHAAVTTDTPEVDGHEDGGQQRQPDNVKRVEANQGVRADLVAAEYNQLRLIAEVGGLAGDAVAYRDRADGQLVP